MQPNTAKVYLKRGASTGAMTFFEEVRLDAQYQMGGFRVCDEFVRQLGIEPPKGQDVIIELRVRAEEAERLTWTGKGWVRTTGCINDELAKAQGFKYCPYCGLKL